MGAMNVKRAEWARAALDGFVGACATDPEDQLADLLCDLMHLADQQGIDFAAELDRATRNYEGEKEDNE